MTRGVRESKLHFVRLTGQDGRQPEDRVSDERLVEQVAQQDLNALAALYDRYAQTVYAVAVNVIGPAEAEDLVQDVFLQLWRKADQFDPERGSFKSWFMRTIRNYAVDQIRSRGREQSLLVVERVDAILRQGSYVDMVEKVRMREDRRYLLRALRALPDEQRLAIVLAYFGGLSQSAIATEMGWPLGTVKKRIRLGLQKLRGAFLLREKGIELQNEVADVGDEPEQYEL